MSMSKMPALKLRMIGDNHFEGVVQDDLFGDARIGVPGDGNCLYHAVLASLASNEELLERLALPLNLKRCIRKHNVRAFRVLARRELLQNSERYLDILGGEEQLFREGVNTIVENGAWGGDLEIQVLASLLGCNIEVSMFNSNYGKKEGAGLLSSISSYVCAQPDSVRLYQPLAQEGPDNILADVIGKTREKEICYRHRKQLFDMADGFVFSEDEKSLVAQEHIDLIKAKINSLPVDSFANFKSGLDSMKEVLTKDAAKVRLEINQALDESLEEGEDLKDWLLFESRFNKLHAFHQVISGVDLEQQPQDGPRLSSTLPFETRSRGRSRDGYREYPPAKHSKTCDVS